jgi:hypothetical protein
LTGFEVPTVWVSGFIRSADADNPLPKAASQNFHFNGYSLLGGAIVGCK